MLKIVQGIYEYFFRKNSHVAEFVKASRLILKTQKNCGIVIGNQAADLDSIASAIALAYYLSNTSCSAFVPVMNTNKTVLSTKKFACTCLMNWVLILTISST